MRLKDLISGRGQGLFENQSFHAAIYIHTVTYKQIADIVVTSNELIELQ